ncbi:OLC1v1033463C2 [Oldenlandia corymbosa var. corymbosa]|uniref:OLC1v1033463C2 n=1 Tax=Oldenlandia corymbosa var. corymbosa TaxID=529605 RepID=A0AAV1CRA3_OLDCO|nr:OLC1v1033463C2 [Oldenlandia corymbosa var. corymbosa]
MFEGLVQKLILGYLGRYIKDFQREQLKITIWSEEVYLENVELILEAFDYLQLPFALQNGRVGKLSIKIPWKKLGWDPIIIVLEDVFISARQREDKEWTEDAINRREYAAKKAKLAAAELAKLSRRVCDSNTGQSFISYITAKILDGIQVSIRNVHILYHDTLTSSAMTVFGLRFSSLTISRQNLVGIAGGKVRGGQVNKLIEVQGLELYCRTLEETDDLASIENSARLEGDENVHLLRPLDVLVSLSVNRSGKLANDAPQYYVNVEFDNLVASLDEVQMQKILILCDYLPTCRLREMYGRYRPWWSPLPKKLKGWQIAWWHYAQKSVLADVRKRLKRTSWKYFGERIDERRKYVRLYKTKLKCLQKDQVIDEDILQALERMERLSDIDDILTYRSVAEREIKDLLMTPPSNRGNSGAIVDMSLGDEQRPSSKPRGWLNWLSRGMLGAGGTDDSSQFSGVISDEVIKDIYEATKFWPMSVSNGDASAPADEILLSSIKISIQQLSFTVLSMRLGCAITRLMLDAISFEFKIWEGSTRVIASVAAAQLVNPSNNQVILCTRKSSENGENGVGIQPSLTIELEVLPSISEFSSSIKVFLQPTEVTFDSEFLKNVVEYYRIFDRLKFLHERVLLSVNDIADLQTRLRCKIDYILSNRKRIMWDVSLASFVLTVPWMIDNLEERKMVIEFGRFRFHSNKMGSFASDVQDGSYNHLSYYLRSRTTAGLVLDFQLEDLYTQYEINMIDFEVRLSSFHSTEAIPILEKLSCSIQLESCNVVDESILKALVVRFSIPSLLLHFSPSILCSINGLVKYLNKLHLESDHQDLKSANALNGKSNRPATSEHLWWSLTATIDSVLFNVNLENDVENGYGVKLCLQAVNVSFDQEDLLDCWISTEVLRVVAYSKKHEETEYVLCSSESKLTDESSSPGVKDFGATAKVKDSTTSHFRGSRCLLLHFESCSGLEPCYSKGVICLTNIDIHYYPFIVVLLARFINGILESGTSISDEDTSAVNDKNLIARPYFSIQKFGFSNFVEAGSSEGVGIPLDCFPFITIRNSGPIVAFENVLVDSVTHWRETHKFGSQKIESPKCFSTKGSKCYYGHFKRSDNGDPLWKSSYSREVFDMEMDLNNVKVHFHDSACLIGSMSVVTAKSSGSIIDGRFDILCSTEGLVVSSSWWTRTISGFLWGPSMPTLSPIFNIRARKEPGGSLELSFSAQHVSCTLPPEFLAVMIGYFSSTDWSSCSAKSSMDLEVNNSTTYKFEIVDSSLFVPVMGDGDQLLKLDIRHFLGCFVGNCDFDLVFKGIPPECPVTPDKISTRNDSLNLFGRDLSLSLVLMEDGVSGSLKLGQLPGHQSFSLVSPLSADIWVRFPLAESSSLQSSFPIYIVGMVLNCQLDVREIWSVAGYEALLDIVNELSLVDVESKLFISDLLEFLQSKKKMREKAVLAYEDSATTATEISLFAQSISIRLHSGEGEYTNSELVAEVETQFLCLVSLPYARLFILDFSLSHLTLFSLLNSVVLVEFPSFKHSSSSSKMNLFASDQEGNRLSVSLPHVNIWMHMFDWREIIVLFEKYKPQPLKMSTVGALTETLDAVEIVGMTRSSVTSSFVLPEHRSSRADFSAKLEGFGATAYIPLLVSGDIFSILEESQIPIRRHQNASSDIMCSNQHGFIALTLESKCSEVLSDGEKLTVKIKLEKVGGVVNLCKNNSQRTWSIFELVLVNVEAAALNRQVMRAAQVELDMDIHVEELDVWLSDDLFYFFRTMLFEVPESEPSPPMFSSFSINVQLRKLSVLLNDGKWSSCGPLVEILITNMLVHSNITDCEMEGSVGGDLLVNYNNIDKVLWEPFVEPWEFLLSISRKYDKSSVLSSTIMTHIHLKSAKQLNLNITESLIEVVSRATEMVKDVWAFSEISAHSSGANFFDSHINEHLDTSRYAPYILQNLTSVPLIFRVCNEKPDDNDDQNTLVWSSGNYLPAGSSMPIYIDESPKKQLFRDRSIQLSNNFDGKQMVGAAHRFISIQLEGTSLPSPPISMDLVGVRYFEADLSLPSTKPDIGDFRRNEGDGIDRKNGFVLPVVIDVSVQRYTKLLRLYSTVVFANATSMPLEVRFDIPFGVAPKILDPIYPGKEFPLPLHLAEAGRMRWRPLGDTYLWSEAYNVSNIISQENRINLPRSFVCYPSHPSSDPFRCCISVEDRCLPMTGWIKKSSDDDGFRPPIKSSNELSHDMETSKQRFMHLVTLSTPLLLRNYLPEAVSVAIENGGVTLNALLSKVESSFFHIDSSHDLTLTFSIRHFKPSILKFPRAETFSAMAKFSGTSFSLSETLTFDSELPDGHLSVNMEKVMDAFSGAREICISIPFLVYNCIGFPLILTNSMDEIKGHSCIATSCYHLDEHDQIVGSKDGLSLLFSVRDFQKAPIDAQTAGLTRNRTSSKSHKDELYSKFLIPGGPSKSLHFNDETPESHLGRSSTLNDGSLSHRQSKLSSDFVTVGQKIENACMYSPCPTSPSGEITVRLSRCPSGTDYRSIPSSSWSNPFLLVPPTGSTSVVVPQGGRNAGYLVSVTAVAAPFSGRTKIITFQPRYVISNACSRALFYKQKGTEEVFLLKAGQHCHIKCTDITKELLVCIRFDEPGWQWSGCFSPEHLGDTQLKMWNYITSTVNMMRVEVQSADVSIEDETVVGNSHGNSGTNLILLSDDDTGFMPYRIDNFSTERLRIYQQRCETFETMVHPYTSHPYAWDEPCFPHRLTVEVLGDRVIGLYTLDDVKDPSPVYLPATPEKSQRTLLVSVHSEGAIKVLSIIDSSYHVLNDFSNLDTRLNFMGKSAQKRETVVHFNEQISVDLPFLGISFMNSYNEEMLFACAKCSRFDLIQSVDQQKFSLHISFLQIDNQLSSTPYPVILSFDNCNKHIQEKIASAIQIDSEGMHEPVISLSVAKWRTKNMSLVSYEYINLRVTDFHLELEQELILSLFKFFRMTSSRLHTRVLKQVDFSVHYPSVSDPENVKGAQFSGLYNERSSSVLPPIVPIGAPWQQIYLLARKQNKTYIELLDIAPIKMTLRFLFACFLCFPLFLAVLFPQMFTSLMISSSSFSSSPWMLRNGVLTLGESLIHRGFMALADVEGAQIHLKELVLSHQLASWESIQEILIRHYTKQSLHEMYKIFGSAGLIGNPMGFMRSMSHGIKDFLSVPVRSILRSPSGLLTGVAQGTTSLLSNTIFAISDAATQFSRAAHKGIVAFTLDDQTVGQMEKQQKGLSSNSKGVINEFLEGLTGLLQSPVQGAEKHGLPGVLSGIALGVTGLVAKPAASILEVTGKTAQSIRNRSKLPHYIGSQRLRVRLPRPLAGGIPLKPYSWEEAVGTAVLRDYPENNSGGNLRDEVLIMSKALRAGGKFVILTRGFILVVSCPCLIYLGKPEFQGVPANPDWAIEVEIGMDSVIHANVEANVVHIIGNSADAFLRPSLSSSHFRQEHKESATSPKGKRWKNSSSHLPIFVTDLEFACKEDADEILQVVLCTIKKGKEQGWSRTHILHKSNLNGAGRGV